jgi:hypothetical protein
MRLNRFVHKPRLRPCTCHAHHYPQILYDHNLAQSYLVFPASAGPCQAINGQRKVPIITLDAFIDSFSSAITSEIAQRIRSDLLSQPITRDAPIGGNPKPEPLRSLAAAAGRTTITMTGLRHRFSDEPEQPIAIGVKTNANLKDIFKEICEMGKSIN